MADKKVSALAAITNLSKDDLFMVVDDPAGTPASKKVTASVIYLFIFSSSFVHLFIFFIGCLLWRNIQSNRSILQ